MQLVPTWKTLKSLSSSPLAKLTIIAPVIGWLLLYNNTLVSLIAKITGEVPANDLWKLYIFYVGLTLISISAILFVIFCPRIISRFIDTNDYINVERAIFTPEMENELSRKLKLKKMEWNAPSDTFKQKSGNFAFSRMQEANETNLLNQMRLIYDTENSRNFLVRLLSIVFFVLGSILAAIPALSTLVWCVKTIYYLWCSNGAAFLCAC